MSRHSAEVLWHREDQSFLDNRYSRKHVIRFDGGVEVSASASPEVVPIPLSDPSAVDPEEMFVASLSSCHMLWFLAIAAKRGFQVDRYADNAVGIMEKNAEGKTFMSVVTLRPKVQFSGEQIPTPEEIDRMHDEAHDACFIANSVRSEVRIDTMFVWITEQ